MSTTFRPSDPSHDVPSRHDLAILRVQRTMFIMNCLYAATFGVLLCHIVTNHDPDAHAQHLIDHHGRMSPPVIRSNQAPAIPAAIPAAVDSEPELSLWKIVPGAVRPPGDPEPARLPVIESSDSGRLFVYPRQTSFQKSSPTSSPAPKFRYRYVTEVRNSCKTCPGGSCSVR